MDLEGERTTDGGGRALAVGWGGVGMWTREVEPTPQSRVGAAVPEVVELGWGWFWLGLVREGGPAPGRGWSCLL